jgi:hypothetical protein
VKVVGSSVAAEHAFYAKSVLRPTKKSERALSSM